MIKVTESAKDKALELMKEYGKKIRLLELV